MMSVRASNPNQSLTFSALEIVFMVLTLKVALITLYVMIVPLLQRLYQRRRRGDVHELEALDIDVRQQPGHLMTPW